MHTHYVCNVLGDKPAHISIYVHNIIVIILNSFICHYFEFSILHHCII